MAVNLSTLNTNPQNYDISSNFEVVVLDINRAVAQQKRLLERYNPKIIPLQERHAKLRYWCPNDVMDSLRAYVFV